MSKDYSEFSIPIKNPKGEYAYHLSLLVPMEECFAFKRTYPGADLIAIFAGVVYDPTDKNLTAILEALKSE